MVSEQGHGVSFRPNENITRQDASVMIYRFISHSGIKLEAGKLDFVDNDAISDYAKTAIESLLHSEIINGMPDGSFAPVNGTTRAEAAKMVYGMLVQIINN